MIYHTVLIYVYVHLNNDPYVIKEISLVLMYCMPLWHPMTSSAFTPTTEKNVSIPHIHKLLHFFLNHVLVLRNNI